ncbi:MAG: hypothetical protein RLZ68_2494 [Pseudomonadota bacterium]|jgi:uncharacterized protein (DUF924 family)
MRNRIAHGYFDINLEVVWDNLRYEQQHAAIIARFGRYPHRNAILGRTSSAEELAFLMEPGSAF